MNFAQANTTLQKESNLLWKLLVNTSHHHTCAVLEPIWNSMQLCTRHTVRPDSANWFPFTPPDFPVHAWLIQHKRLFLPTRPPKWFVFSLSVSCPFIPVHLYAGCCADWVCGTEWNWIQFIHQWDDVKSHSKAKSVHTAALWGKRSVPVDFQ